MAQITVAQCQPIRHQLVAHPEPPLPPPHNLAERLFGPLKPLFRRNNEMLGIANNFRNSRS
jgi:hypothetical protein